MRPKLARHFRSEYICSLDLQAAAIVIDPLEEGAMFQSAHRTGQEASKGRNTNSEPRKLRGSLFANRRP
jgi:hypothetical protein